MEHTEWEDAVSSNRAMRGPNADTGIFGAIRGISLVDLLQVISLGHYTCSVSTTNDIQGVIYFKDGAPWHAEAKGLVGVEAFAEIVQSNPLEFRIDKIKPQQRTLTHSLDTLLLSAFAGMDEDSQKAQIDDFKPVERDLNGACAEISEMLDDTVSRFSDVRCAAVFDPDGEIVAEYIQPGTSFDRDVHNCMLQACRAITEGIRKMGIGESMPFETTITSSKRIYTMSSLRDGCVFGMCMNNTGSLGSARAVKELLTRILVRFLSKKHD